MGNAASLFDCAVNPLTPSAEAEEALVDRPQPLEEGVPLRDSKLWGLQRAFYEDQGLAAWTDAVVPNFVTSNSFIARAYARMILSFLRDVYGSSAGSGATRKAGVDYTQPVYIVELGAGHGKLGYLIVEGLLRYRAFFPKTDVPGGVPFRYVLTDAVARDVAAWKEHDTLKEFFDEGVLDVAVFDAEKDTEIKLELSGITLTPGTLTNPLFAIANYTFDSLRTDAFRVVPPGLVIDEEDGNSAVSAAGAGAGGPPVLEQACLTLFAKAGSGGSGTSGAGAAGAGAAPEAPTQAGADVKAAAPAAPSATATLRSMTTSWSYKPVTASALAADPTYGAAPLLAGLVAGYAASPAFEKTGGSFLVPVGAYRALASLHALAGGRLMLLAGDKGYASLREMTGVRDPHLATHGSVSLMVNFHALRKLAEAMGGTSLRTPYAEGFKVVAFAFNAAGAAAPASAPPAAWAAGFGHATADGAAPHPDDAIEADASATGLPMTTLLSLADAEAVAGSHYGEAAAAAVAPSEEAVAKAAAAVETAAAAAAVLPGAPAPARHTLAATSQLTFGLPAPAVPPAAAASFPSAAAVFASDIARFSPEDFSTLQRCLREEVPEPSLRLVLALLRLANHDADVFYKFKGVFIDKAAFPHTSETLARDIRGDIDRVFASYYPLQTGKDTCFELGRLLMGLRDYSSAVDFFARSNECCGNHPVTWHNMGICLYYLEDYQTAVTCFQNALDLQQTPGRASDARAWLQKAMARAAGSSGGGGGGGEAAGAAVAGKETAEAGAEGGGGSGDAGDAPAWFGGSDSGAAAAQA